MKEQKTSLWERLKVCWNVLTKENYIYFGLDKDPLVFGEDGKYARLKKNGIAAFSYVSNDYRFLAYGKETTLHDFVWESVKEYAEKVLKGEF